MFVRATATLFLFVLSATSYGQHESSRPVEVSDGMTVESAKRKMTEIDEHTTATIEQYATQLDNLRDSNLSRGAQRGQAREIEKALEAKMKVIEA